MPPHRPSVGDPKTPQDHKPAPRQERSRAEEETDDPPVIGHRPSTSQGLRPALPRAQPGRITPFSPPPVMSE